MIPLSTDQEELLQSLRSLTDAFQSLDARWRLDWSLSSNEALVISQLWEAGSVTMADVGRRVGLTSGGVTALVDRLVRDGYVERQTDEDDRRRSRLVLTSLGERTRSMLDGVFQDTAVSLDPATAVPVIDAVSARLLASEEHITRNLYERAAAPGEGAPA